MGEVEEVFVSGIEVFTDGRWMVGGEREEFFDLGPVEQVPCADDLDPEGDREIGGDIFGILFVIEGGKEVKRFCLEDAFGGGFAQAGLSQKYGLATGGDGLTNGGELFESFGHGRRTWGERSG